MDYERLEQDILMEYSQIAWSAMRMEALKHTLAVVYSVTLLWKQGTQEDFMLLKTAALLHDLGRFRLNQVRDHAKLSAMLLRDMLGDYGYTKEQTEKVAHIVSVHSDKHRKDGELEELLKDADVLARWLDNPIHYRHPRLEKIQNNEETVE